MTYKSQDLAANLTHAPHTNLTSVVLGPDLLTTVRSSLPTPWSDFDRQLRLLFPGRSRGKGTHIAVKVLITPPACGQDLAEIY